MARSATHRSASFLARLRRAKGFWRADKGAAALEFAMVATPFFVLLFGVIELGLILMAQVDLENAMGAATREIRTGLTQSAASSTDQTVQNTNFGIEVCKKMLWMISDCEHNITVDVRTYGSFGAISLNSAPADQAAILAGKPQFQTGGPGSIVVVRAYYAWPLFIPGLDTLALTGSTNKTLLTSVTSFENEPFTASPPPTVTPANPDPAVPWT
jgi:Flp pilus assembly protein TadG